MAIVTEMLLEENVHIIKPVHLTNFSILFISIILFLSPMHAQTNLKSRPSSQSHSTTPCAENPPNIPTRSTFKNERVRKKMHRDAVVVVSLGRAFLKDAESIRRVANALNELSRLSKLCVFVL